MNQGRKKFIAAISLAIAMAPYPASYLALTLQGRYEPEGYGVDHVKWHGWAPRGFVANYEWNRTLIRVYFPLYLFDRRFWHSNDGSYWDDGYPINNESYSEIVKAKKQPF